MKFLQHRLFKSRKFSIGLLVVSTLMLTYTIVGLVTAQDIEEVPLAEITAQLEDPDQAKKIDKIVLDDAQRLITVSYEDEDRAWEFSSYVLETGDELLELAGTNDVEAEVKNNFSIRSASDVLISMIPILIIVAVLIWLVMSTTNGGSSNSNGPISEIPKTRFTDLAGVDEAIEDLGEVTDFLKNTTRFKELGARSPKGVLLYGAPGTGKTELAKAVAGEAEVPFFATTGSAFQEMFVGLGARRVRQLFKAARKYPAAIIFIDELDSVGGKRSTAAESPDSREHSRTINALLSEMDGFEDSNVIVIAATNHPDSLDPALTRAGRFDRKISVDLPDWKGRLGILEIHAKGKPLADNVDFESLSKSTTGLAGADLENLVNEALICAGRAGRDAATQEDFMEALSVVTLGRARKSAVITDFDREVTAYHEAGHTVLGLALPELPNPTHVTIVPRGLSGGHTKLQEPEDRFQKADALRARLAMMMGGLAAERKLLGDITQGPGSDLKAATDLATKMVSKMGMGAHLSVVEDQSVVVNPGVSEHVRNEVETLLRAAVDKATEVLDSSEWEPVYLALGAKLLEVDSLEVDEIQALVTQVQADRV